MSSNASRTTPDHPGPSTRATSPSLRSKTVAEARPTKQATAVGRMFASNSDLWPLIVSTVIGQQKHNGSVAALYATCREARHAIKTAHAAWRQKLSDRRDSVIEATASLRAEVEGQV